MRFVVDRKDFAAVLTQAAKFTAPRVPSPILSTVLLRAGDGAVEIATTSLDLHFTASLDARVETEGAVAANAGLLAAFVRGAVGPDVELGLGTSLLRASAGHVHARIPTIDAADFPEPFRYGAVNTSFEIDGAVLAASLDAVRYAVSDEQTRFYLTGASWQIQNARLELAATDGRFLSLIGIDTPAGAEGLKPMIVPDFPMPGFAGPVRVEVAATWIRFAGTAGHRVAVTSKLIDGTFPDYRHFIQPAKVTATVERKALVDAVTRCAPFCQDRKTHAPINLVHDDAGVLVVCVNGADGAGIEDTIGIEGSQFTVSLNSGMLAETLASFDGETIEIGLSEVGSNVRFSEPGNNDRLGIVMPMASTSLPYRIGPPKAVAAE